MPERSFGRTVRYRRTKLGLSQAKLGDLVGRSANTIRSWERDSSTPTDPTVLLALAAVLGLDEAALFEKAGVGMPPRETHPTVEQALASLRSPPPGEPAEPEAEAEEVPGDEVPGDDLEQPRLDPDSALEAETTESGAGKVEEDEDEEPEAGFEPFPIRPERESRPVVMSTSSEPAFVAPPEPYQVMPPTPPLVEPSYLEDTEQRQLYRVRHLATLVLVVAMIVVFLWSLGNTLEALGDWWDAFVSTLRL